MSTNPTTYFDDDPSDSFAPYNSSAQPIESILAEIANKIDAELPTPSLHSAESSEIDESEQKVDDQEPLPQNLTIQWETPCQEIKQEFEYEGVEQADPDEYRLKHAGILTPSRKLPQFVKHFNVPSNFAIAADAESEESHTEDSNVLVDEEEDKKDLPIEALQENKEEEEPTKEEEPMEDEEPFLPIITQAPEQTVVETETISDETNSEDSESSSSLPQSVSDDNASRLDSLIDEVVASVSMSARAPVQTLLPELNEKADYLIDELALEFLIDKLANNLNYDQLIADLVNYYSSNPKKLMGFAKKRVVYSKN